MELRELLREPLNLLALLGGGRNRRVSRQSALRQGGRCGRCDGLLGEDNS